jgi:hypothetical protein
VPASMKSRHHHEINVTFHRILACDYTVFLGKEGSGYKVFPCKEFDFFKFHQYYHKNHAKFSHI